MFVNAAAYAAIPIHLAVRFTFLVALVATAAGLLVDRAARRLQRGPEEAFDATR